jgi:predicted alpha/beta superfamily hydrolase
MKNLILVLITVFLIPGSEKLFSQSILPSDNFDNVSLKLFDSEVLNETRKIFIYVPTENSENLYYPVLYILDGEMIDQYGEALNCVQTNKEVGPHIIVGIETVENRNRDMIPVKMVSRPEAGGADKFLQFLISELQPYIDSNFNTTGDNILYGASTAGLFPVYTMLEHSEAFFGYISSSTMIGHCPEYMNNKVIDCKPKSQMKGKYLYIHYGMKDQFKQVVDYLPDYYEFLKEQFGDNLIMELKGLKDKGHVPAGGIEEGLIFIYKNKNAQ